MWKDIVGFEELYQISNNGKVRSLSRRVKTGTGTRVTPEKIIKQCLNSDGYFEVGLHCAGTVTKRTVHSLVAQAFVPNPKNLPISNHKDENKQNNAATNLEWCTNEYNLHYGTISSRKKNTSLGKPVVQCNLDGSIVQEYISLSAAARALNKGSASLIRRCCEGINKSAYGFAFSYKN